MGSSTYKYDGCHSFICCVTQPNFDPRLFIQQIQAIKIKI